MDNPDWIDKTFPIDVVTLDVGFVISPSFYYGPSNRFTKEEWDTLREPLYQPNLDLYKHHALCSQVESNVSELLDYYRDVLRLIRKYTKEDKSIQAYFRVRPLIFKLGVVDITFPWYDTLRETRYFLESIASPASGQIFHDVEQGWEIEVFGQEEGLYVRQRDPDHGEERASIHCARHTLQEQVPVVIQRTNKVIAQLKTEFGKDYWSGS